MDRLAAKKMRRRRRRFHIRKKISGTQSRPRLSVYRSNRYIYIQAIDDQSGQTLTAVSNREKTLLDVRSITADAGKIGLELAERLKKKKITHAIFDRNGYLYHGIVKAVADGARKGGIQF